MYYLLVTLSSMTAIIFAKSTGALVGIGTGLLFMGGSYFFLESKRKLVQPLGLPCLQAGSTFYILILTGIILSLLTIPKIKNELLLRDWSGHVRKTQWSETWTMLKDTSTPLGAGRPIIGAGLSGYKTALAPYHKATYLEIFEYPHNIVLNFWSETGLLGLLVFLWIIILFFRNTRHHAAIASMVVILIHGLVDVPYFKNDLAILFWIIYALGLLSTKTPTTTSS